jgi:HEAT repeat protein
VEEPENPERQGEILTIFRILLPNLLGRGAIASAAPVLGELAKLEALPEVLDGPRRGLVAELLEEVSSPVVIGELVAALEIGSISTQPTELSGFLVHLRAQALATLIRASETVAVKALKPVIRDAVGRIALENPRALLTLISAEDPEVAAGAARIAGSFDLREASPALQQLLLRPQATVRLAAIEAIVLLRAVVAAASIQGVLSDPDRQVRIAAARALGGLRHSQSAARFREVLSGKEIRDADVTEKIAFFEGYGELRDPEGVPFLDKLLNGRSLIGRREPAEIRAAAALALGKLGTVEARLALEKAAKDEDVVVRSAVSRVFRGTGAAS